MTSTSHANERGSARQRRARKEWLVAEYGWPDPVEPSLGLVCCWLCDGVMILEDVTVDRVVPGIEGGRYVKGNIRPACLADNLERGGRLGAERLKVRRVVS